MFALAGFNPPEHGNHIGSEAETNPAKAKRRNQGNGNGHTGDELDSRCRVIVKEPEIAAAAAMPKSIRFGEERAVISDW
ncbi:MAG: hypothetical protein VXZ59_06180 [Cyanobacteriota bacterium]|nr:hypothetical protein [Cyanobacteriota bacterium]